MIKIFRWALQLVSNQRRFTAYYCLSLALGLSSFFVVEVLRTSVGQAIEQNSRLFLAADLNISGRFPLTGDQQKQVLKLVGEKGQMTLVRHIYSMVRAEDRSQLIQLRVIDRAFPLYGELKFAETNMPSDGGEKKSVSGENNDSSLKEEIFLSHKIWTYPELLNQLKKKVGDWISIGQGKFQISRVIDQDVGVALGQGSFAPRIYLAATQLEVTGLVQKGSTLYYNYLVVVDDQKDFKQVLAQLKTEFTDLGYRVSGHQEASEASAQPLSYLSDFLGLVAIVALLLSFLGMYFLLRQFLQNQLRSVAILRCLGLSMLGILGVYLCVALMLSLLSLPIAILAALVIVPALVEMVVSLTPFSFAVIWTSSVFVQVGLLAFIGPLLMSLPLLLALRDVKPIELLQEGERFSLKTNKWHWLWFLPLATFYWVLSCLQAHSFKIGTLFFASFILAGGIVALLFYIILRCIRLLKFKSWEWRSAVLMIQRHSLRSSLVFLALCLGVVLLHFLLVIETSLQKQIQAPDENALPSFFLIDIQDEQISELQQFVNERGEKLTSLSPMIRARILTVNGKEFVREKEDRLFSTRESERSDRFRTRGMNLSFRSKLSGSERIVSGKPYPSVAFDSTQQAYPGISVEERFADRLNLKLGDILEFDILGVAIKGQIVNFRDVKWTSFQPNFFVQFQPGVLEDAPKTWIATIPPLKHLSLSELQSQMVERFPNISVVNISRLVVKIIEIMNKMSLALKLMAFVCLFAGFFILLVLTQSQIREMRRSYSLLKVLGASLYQIKKMILFQFAIITTLSCVLGILISTAMAYIFAKILFADSFSINISYSLTFLFAVPLIGICCAYLVASNELKKTVQAVL